MTDAPERPFAHVGNNDCVVSFKTPSESYNVEYLRADIAPQWQPIETILKDGTWVVMADIDAVGMIILAHADVIVLEVGAWYLNADVSAYNYWMPLAKFKPS
jgi:hypothetical protein